MNEQERAALEQSTRIEYRNEVIDEYASHEEAVTSILVREVSNGTTDEHLGAIARVLVSLNGASE